MKFGKFNINKYFNSSNNSMSRGGNYMNDNYRQNSSRYSTSMPEMPQKSGRCRQGDELRDRGNEPVVFDIQKEGFKTSDFRTALWTGSNLQLTVMTLLPEEEIGIEKHDNIDQLIGVISGAGEVIMGKIENNFGPSQQLDTRSVVLVPAGTYHNIKNVGRSPLKLYSVYAPKAHKFGTVDKNNPM